MNYPEFFDNTPKIVLKDDLANELGTFKDGIVEFSYLDIVKCAGHSCPTVSGAFICTLVGLKALYSLEIPKRGEIKVELPECVTEGVTGVLGAVIANITVFELNDNGQMKSIKVRFTVNQALRLGKAIKFKVYNDGSNAFEEYLNSQLNYKNRISGTEVELIHSLVNGMPYQLISETVCNDVSKIEEMMQSLLIRFNVRSKHGLLDFAFENFLLPNHSYS